jgi:hypothetical protein
VKCGGLAAALDPQDGAPPAAPAHFAFLLARHFRRRSLAASRRSASRAAALESTAQAVSIAAIIRVSLPAAISASTVGASSGKCCLAMTANRSGAASALAWPRWRMQEGSSCPHALRESGKARSPAPSRRGNLRYTGDPDQCIRHGSPAAPLTSEKCRSAYHRSPLHGTHHNPGGVRHGEGCKTACKTRRRDP